MYDLNNKLSFNSPISKMNKEYNQKELNSNNENKYNNKIKTNFKKTIIRRNSKIHNDFGRRLTYNKKILSELDSLPSNIYKLFRKSLDKYKFNLEVYVPHSMRISKKEYYNKDYMLNNLVKTNNRIEGEKNKIINISKETKKFSKQYKLVKDENSDRQNDYLINLEKEYLERNKNFKELKYKKEDNIFTPSFLLDTNYGDNLNADVYKYGINSYENKNDKRVLNKFYDVINKIKNDKEKEEIKENNTLDEKEEKIAKIKKDLIEEMRIKNMNRKEYFYYSQKLKKEINTVKNLLNENNKIEYLSPEKNTKISFELNNENNKTEENMKSKKSFKTKNIKSKYQKEIDIIDKIPKLQLNNIIPNLNENKKNANESKSIRLNQLYITLSERGYTNNSDAPYNQITQYFKKYNPKKLPQINNDKGSNIHGLAESVQKSINENNVEFSKLNDDLKKDMFNKNNNIKNINETENIINVDNKILGLHYDFIDNLLSNKRNSFLKSYEK